MVATSNPFGFQAAAHLSGGVIRQKYRQNGIASGFATAIFTGTPIKNTATDGTLIPCTTGADTALGVFQGCEFTDTAGVFHISPFWPASQAYQTTLQNGAGVANMQVYYTDDPNILYDVQANGSVPQSGIGQAANLANTSQGSTFTGISTQALNATLTGATPGLCRIIDIPEGSYFSGGVNAAGDAFTIVRVQFTYQPVVA